MNYRIESILQLRPNAQWSMADDNVLRWKDTHQTQPTEEEIQAKIAELEAAEPLRQLRIERDRLLAETDWWCVSDRTPTQEQLEYRQALRDIPSIISPELDENGLLTNINWPEKPK